MVKDGDSTNPSRSSYSFVVQELVNDANTVLRAFVLLMEVLGKTTEYPFHLLEDPYSLQDREICVEYEGSQMVRYTVKHHGEVTGELVAPNRITE